MVIECITIILIILMISFIFLRSKRENYALVTLPLISVPLLHLVGQFIIYFFIKEDQNAAVITNLSFDLLGLLIGALLDVYKRQCGNRICYSLGYLASR